MVGSGVHILKSFIVGMNLLKQKKNMTLKKSQRSLRKWTKQKWRTPSGKKSSETGEVYAPEAKIKKLKSTPEGRRKLAAANKKKREATAKGKQHAQHGLHRKTKKKKKK